MKSCKELTALMTDFTEGRLSFMERVAFHMHIGMCSSCRNYLKQLKEVQGSLGELEPVPMPADIKDELLQRFRNWPATEAIEPNQPGDPNE